MTDGGARELCRSLLARELPRRWAHCQGVARRAGTIERVLGEYGGVLEAAAWLHDIGYATPLADSGFHPLDGARYLRDRGFGDRAVWTLVAHHTCAQIEADERGLGEVLVAEFPIADAAPSAVAALTYCDMTTGPDGQPVDVGGADRGDPDPVSGGSCGASVDRAGGAGPARAGRRGQRSCRNSLNHRRARVGVLSPVGASKPCSLRVHWRPLLSRNSISTGSGA